MYKKPEVTLLSQTPLAVSEVAARTCYDSFDKASDEVIKNFKNSEKPTVDGAGEDTDLLYRLVNVNFHESIIEHTVFNFFVSGLSRGVLMQLTRHRIASYSVRSTRYTLTDLIYVFFASNKADDGREFFRDNIPDDLLVLNDKRVIDIEVDAIYAKLCALTTHVNDDAIFAEDKDLLHKTAIAVLDDYEDADEALKQLRSLTVSKRNAGDKIKSIVTDNFSTELMFTFNARELKSFLKLRQSKSAWGPMQDFANQVVETLPDGIRTILKV